MATQFFKKQSKEEMNIFPVQRELELEIFQAKYVAPFFKNLLDKNTQLRRKAIRLLGFYDKNFGTALAHDPDILNLLQSTFHLVEINKGIFSLGGNELLNKDNLIRIINAGSDAENQAIALRNEQITRLGLGRYFILRIDTAIDLYSPIVRG